MTDKKKIAPKRTLTYHAIFYGFTLTILLIDSIAILLSGLRRGIYKKETLSKESKLGFDVKIIMR